MEGQICTIDDKSWLASGKLLISRETTGPSEAENRIPSIEEGETVSYSFRELADNGPVPQTQPDKPIPFPMVYSAGTYSAGKIGYAYLKAALIEPSDNKVTREHVTLEAISHIAPRSGLEVPRSLYHGEWDDRYLFIVNAMKGQTLNRAWTTMEHGRKADCMRQVANFKVL
ncbi:hypothetical protein K470DRAFT_257122 [Piedraia hortae CBS 480.64]|uniref:Uncharacterized protein n=1 Tax=Piedraia hortae CBS 480.64 TaxID=1314780 RepID=A0A6A7C133_9PEZI|nr:hypothetical protein K470DRAFT_257122 [Piedraia hortae CBS 480.64]